VRPSVASPDPRVVNAGPWGGEIAVGLFKGKYVDFAYKKILSSPQTFLHPPVFHSPPATGENVFGGFRQNYVDFAYKKF
jgi:hypothetical protein